MRHSLTRADASRTASVLLLCIVFLVLLLVPRPTLATGLQNQVVRVGWYQSNMFQNGMGDDQIKSGYCYDYLQYVANYSGWSYEYVYGTWSDLFAMLQSGEIDILGGVSESP